MRTIKTKQIESMKWALRLYIILALNIMGITAMIYLLKLCYGILV
tara:strand:- start:4549 stop:4683 length:135 start_codon:yes stop_codon:yes gene_type:complete